MKAKFIGVLLSMIGLAFAWSALMKFIEHDYGNTLIYAGAAISFSIWPFSNISWQSMNLPMKELAAETVRRPWALRYRIATLLSGALIFSGIGFQIFYP
jgi:hypothetical protein